MKTTGIIISLLLLSLLGGCATLIPVGERAQKREEIKQIAQETINELTADDQALQTAIDNSTGYFVAQVSAASAPVVGGGFGIGVLYDKQNATRTYMNVRRYDLGMGLGVRKFRILLVFNNREALDEFRRGGWDTGIGTEMAAGTTGAATAAVTRTEKFDFSVHFLTETGAQLAASLRLIKVSTNYDLTHTGVSDISIPNIGFTTVDETPPDAPRQWDRALPFLAQQVIDKGYDLPLPYGVGLAYANVKQDMLLDQLEIGFGGSDKVPIQFVSFDNASSESETAQIKLDAWLFPFMNVFALLGKLDGKAPLEFTIDGDDALSQLGIDCTPPVPPSDVLICNALGGRNVTVPIEADFQGNTYGIGTVLAGGWNNFFVTIPITFTYADMEDKETEGTVLTVSPKIGRVVSFRNAGNLALYIGGSYLDSELTIAGTQIIPGTSVGVDYKIRQRNKDKWNAVIGGNYDINKRWSIVAEYGGFTGSRETVVASVTYRY